MKGYVCLAVLLFGTALFAQSTAEKEVVQVQQKWLVASQKGDSSTLRQILDDNFIGSTPNDYMVEKHNLFPPKGNDPVFANTHFEDLAAKVIGNAAIVFSKMVTGGNSSFLRCEMVYMRREGEWKMVAAQLVPTTAEEEKKAGQ